MHLIVAPVAPLVAIAVVSEVWQTKQRTRGCQSGKSSVAIEEGCGYHPQTPVEYFRSYQLDVLSEILVVSTGDALNFIGRERKRNKLFML